MSAFYKKFINPARKGYSLEGGPHAKWRLPLAYQLYKKRLDAGPEPERPRSVWSNWNYDSEIYALTKRLNENNTQFIRQAFINPSYAVAEKNKLAELGVEFDATKNNAELAEDGEKICRNYLRAVFNFWYPKLPEQGVDKLVEYLLETEKLEMILKNIGGKDLIKTEEFPVHQKTSEASFYALVGAIGKDDVVRAQLFVNDFVLTQLIGQDINEIWSVENPMGLLVDELKLRGYKSLPVSRLIWSTGATHPTGAFIVGLYLDEKFLAKGSGETVDIAEEMAARDALRRLFGTGEDAAPVPFGEKAKKYSAGINGIYEILSGKN